MDTQVPLSNMNVDTSRIEYIAIIGILLLFLFIFELTRKGAIRIPYSLLWFFLTAGFLVISIQRDILTTFAVMVGVAYAPAALFLLLIIGIIGILIHFSTVVSALSDQSCKLTQELGYLRLHIDKQHSRFSLPQEDTQQSVFTSEPVPKALVIIPAFNESNSIRQTVESVQALDYKADILVINDGSTDATGTIAEQIPDIQILHHTMNLGIGAAMQSGFLYAVRNNYDYAFQFDGDGQHNAPAIEEMLEILSGIHAPDVVIGSRFIEKETTGSFRSTKTRRLGIRLLSIVIRLLSGVFITDVTSGFRGYNRKALQLVSHYYPSDFPEPEAIILFSKAGLTIKETAVSMNKRHAGRSSISGLKSVYYIVKVLVALIIYALRPAKYT